MLTHSKLAAFSPGNFHRILGVDTRNFRGARFAGGYGITMHNDIVRMLLEGCKLSGTAVDTEIHDGSLGEKEAQRQRAGNLFTFDPDGKGTVQVGTRTVSHVSHTHSHLQTSRSRKVIRS